MCCHFRISYCRFYSFCYLVFSLHAVTRTVITCCDMNRCYMLWREPLLHAVTRTVVTCCGENHCYMLWRELLLHAVTTTVVTCCGDNRCYMLWREPLLHGVATTIVTCCDENRCYMLWRQPLLHAVVCVVLIVKLFVNLTLLLPHLIDFSFYHIPPQSTDDVFLWLSLPWN
jgi:hypothetical protein